jgi:L-lactate utilization protein LutC
MSDDLLERFCAELTALNVMHRVVETAEEVRTTVANMVAGHTVLMWHPEFLPYGLGDSIVGILEGAREEIQGRAHIGLTGCHGAIAESGTLALIGGPGRARSVSLLPPVHIAVVDRSVICEGMADFFQMQGGALGAANTAFITGSRGLTDSDITGGPVAESAGRLIVVIGP